jgi:superoxide dismutase, Cu-Zn family
MKRFVTFFSCLTFLTSCQENISKQKTTPTEKEQVTEYTTAYSIIKPASGSQVIGTVSFHQVEGGLRIWADVAGLTPGKHGFHIHEHGDCSSHDASSAGGHFNPTGTKHGGPDSKERHVGDLGNLEANDEGFAHYERIDTLIELNGENSIIGKSIVIHEGEDDLETQPTGNSGARIGCGEIKVVQNSPMDDEA